MSHEAFGKLSSGQRFNWRGRTWIKVAERQGNGKRYNATTIDGDTNKAEAKFVDEATLVGLDCSPVEKKVVPPVITLFALRRRVT